MNRSVFITKGGKGTTSEFKYGLISSKMSWRMMKSFFEEGSFDCSVCSTQRRWEELERALLKEEVITE